MITIAVTARCQRCDWTAAGSWAEVDRAAGKHTRTTSHPTATMAEPAATTMTRKD